MSIVKGWFGKEGAARIKAENRLRYDQIKYKKLIKVDKIEMVEDPGYKKIYGTIKQDYVTDSDIAVICDQGQLEFGGHVFRINNKFICIIITKG